MMDLNPRELIGIIQQRVRDLEKCVEFYWEGKCRGSSWDDFKDTMSREEYKIMIRHVNRLEDLFSEFARKAGISLSE